MTAARACGATIAVAVALGALAPSAHAQPVPETIIQYFETDWAEITARMPELAAAGYTALWLPPPTKGAEGIVDVGFSVFDRFDLGDRDQRGTIRTKYGTREDLVRMVAEAHRLGLKVYFDIVMNHNANPAKLENPAAMLQPARIDEFPGTHPLDYHVLPARMAATADNWVVRNPAYYGSTEYELAPDRGNNEQYVATTPIPMGTTIPGFTHLARAPSIDFSRNDRTQELNYSLLGLIDFALEQDVTPSGPGMRDAYNLVADQPLPRFIRNPDRPETYPNATPVAEDIRQYMMRWIAWFGDVSDADGLRLDAIKHAPAQFFGSDFPSDPIDFCGTFQRNLDARRGYTDGDDNDGVDDALLFGESYTGDLGALSEYWRSGMFVLDFPLLFKIANDGGVFSRGGDGDMGQLTFPQGGMNGRYDEFGGLGRNAGVTFVQSHDTPAPRTQPNGAYAYILTRVGHSVVFYDGNNANPETFVQPGRLDAVGELGSTVITDLVDIRRRFARGGQFNRFVDGDDYVYERVVPTTDGTGGATLLVAITDNTQAESRFGEFDPRPLVVTEFPPGTELVELTGNGATPMVTVLDPAAVPARARDAALAAYDMASDFPVPARYGLVYFQLPAGPDRGYVAYAPRTPDLAVSLTGSGGAALTTRTITTVGARRTPAGSPVPAATITPSVLRLGARLDVAITADALASAVYVAFDRPGVQLPGLTAASGTPERAFDGWFEAQRDGAAFVLRDVDPTSLGEGVHVVRVRAARAGTPVFWSEARAMVELSGSVMPPADGGVAPGADAAPSGGDGGPMIGADAAAPGDAGGPSADRDPDRDGVVSDDDVCPAVFDPEQRDFDDDGRGDACDACPETAAGEVVDADGCAAVAPELRADLEAIVEAILSRTFEARLDQNADGAIDAIDFVLRSRAGGTR